MRILCQIRAFEHLVGRDVFSKLAKLCPDAVRNGVFYLTRPLEDRLNSEVITVLLASGLKMRPNAWVSARSEFIDIQYNREFDEQDRSGAAYLEVRAEDDVAHGDDRTKAGNLVLESENLHRRFRVAGVSGKPIVSDYVRQLIQEQRFEHVLFRRCEIVGDEAERFEDFPVWELTSDLTLPPLSPECKFCDCYGGDEITNPDKGCTVNDGLYLPVQLRYRSSDLREVGPFDVAHTREAFGFNLSSHPVVVSQRFYQFSKKEKFRLWWFPIRIDPE